MQGGVVDKEAVRFLAMLAESFAMVAGDNDQRPVIYSLGSQIRDHASHLRVHEGNSTTVGMATIFLQIRRRRVVRMVGVVEMDPQEEGLLPRAIEPAKRTIYDFAARSHHSVDVFVIQTAKIEVIIVELKSAA